jgi:hypothetical protein
MITLMHNTINIRDHSFNNKMYSSCFTAASAIDWLLINGYVDSRAEGVQLCQDLVDNGSIIPLTTDNNMFLV